MVLHLLFGKKGLDKYKLSREKLASTPRITTKCESFNSSLSNSLDFAGCHDTREKSRKLFLGWDIKYWDTKIQYGNWCLLRPSSAIFLCPQFSFHMRYNDGSRCLHLLVQATHDWPSEVWPQILKRGRSWLAQLEDMYVHPWSSQLWPVVRS